MPQINLNDLTRQMSQQDTAQLLEARKGLVEAGLDLDYENAQYNVDLLENYFETYRQIPVTVSAVYKAVEANKNSYKWLSPARQSYEGTKAQNPEQMASIERYYAGKGLVADIPDQRYENLVLLFHELNNWQISSDAVAKACGRISAKAGKQLHFVAQTGYKPSAARLDEEARQAAEKNKPIGPEYVHGRLNHASVPDPETQTVSSSRIATAAQSQATSLKGETHSDTEQSQSIFATDSQNNIDWVRTLDSRKNVQASLQRARETRRFIR